MGDISDVKTDNTCAKGELFIFVFKKMFWYFFSIKCRSRFSVVFILAVKSVDFMVGLAMRFLYNIIVFHFIGEVR